MKIILFRHGQVENPDNVLYGRLPGFHLSAEGRQTVEERAKLLIGHDIKMIYSSPLERTTETAEIIASTIGYEEDIIISDEIIEVDTREWTGKSYLEFKQHLQSLDDPINRTETESLPESGGRLHNYIQRLITKNEDAIVVSHGDPIMGAIGLITGNWAIYENYIPKGSFVLLNYENGNFGLLPYNSV